MLGSDKIGVAVKRTFRRNRYEKPRRVQVAILLRTFFMDDLADEPDTFENYIWDAHRRIIPFRDAELPASYDDLFGLILREGRTYCQGIITPAKYRCQRA